MTDFFVRFYHTWRAIKHVRLGKLPQSEHPIYVDAFSREYCRRFAFVDVSSYFSGDGDA